MNHKLIVVAAPSGAGKTTIVKHLLKTFDNLAFSVSATTRERRNHEEQGRDYYYISEAEFRQNIEKGEFLEWQEVYKGQFYGTLHREIKRLWDLHKVVIFDIDVRGALNIKKTYPNETLLVFVKPPSKEILIQRLKDRNTESEESLSKRIEKASFELGFESEFDVVLLNDKLEPCLARAEKIVREYLDLPT
ncbi:MAG: guanylate kinase [Saprospiraceae bacterium]